MKEFMRFSVKDGKLTPDPQGALVYAGDIEHMQRAVSECESLILKARRGGSITLNPCYEWLSAQRLTCALITEKYDLRELIQNWSQSWSLNADGDAITIRDVEDAAKLLGLVGDYPYYNISPRLTFPAMKRLHDQQHYLSGMGQTIKMKPLPPPPINTPAPYAEMEERDLYHIDKINRVRMEYGDGC